MNVLKEHFQDQPFEISLETYAICNARCSFCPYPDIDRKGVKMSDELIDKVIDEMSTFIMPFYFSPFKVSDPLLDKRLFSILQKVNKKAPIARTRIFTNALALTKERAEELHNINNLEMWISLNEYRAKEYQALMGAKFDKVVKNIDMLHESDFCHPVTLGRVGVDQGFRDFCEKRWPDFKVAMIKKDGWLGYTKPDDWTPQGQCTRWYELSILSTGIVSLCCMDAHGDYSIGDINKESLMDVYNRWDFRKHETRENLTPCKECTY